MASASDDPIALWLKLGALDKLEQALLDGYGDQLRGRSSRIPQVARFLKQVPAMQAQMEEMHEGAMQGRLGDVRTLADERRQLAYCRDQQGASPLHKSVLFQQRPLVAYFVQHFPAVMHARDHQGRTPLHYAAVVQDNGEIYRMLKTAGSDENATDVYGHTPDFYLDAPGELTLEQLKEGTASSRLKKSKHRRKKSGDESNTSVRGFSAKPAGLKVQIREVIGQGNLEALEELVLHGHGDRLLGETSPNPLVQEFLDIVPGYIEQISDVHRAVVRGRLREVQTLMSHRSLSLARDSLGATPVHKAVMHGHYDVAQHLADNFRDALCAKDVDGRTPLHYAAGLKDGRRMYNMLISAGSPTTIVDSKGKTADYYLQYPEKLGLDQIIKRNQLANATHLGNTVSRLKALAPPAFQKTIVNMHERYQHSNGRLNGNHEGHVNGDDENQSEGSQETLEEKSAQLASQQDSLKKVMMRTKPMLPPVILPRLEVNSANIRKWIDEQDLQKLEGAVFEGYGQRLAQEPSVQHEQVEQYLRRDVPQLLERIRAIHRAVSEDDVRALESQLQSPDYALARDHLGMTPLHRAVVLGRHDVARLLIDRFPETINARDREGRTALHYAAAASRRSGRADMYRLLLQNGSDPRIRDNRGKSSEYYKTHHLPLAPEVAQLSSSARNKARSLSEPPGSKPRKNPYASTAVNGKLTAALQKGDPAEIRELILEGHGRHLLGRTSWNEEVRHLLKGLPQFLHQVSDVHESISRGDVERLKELAASDAQLLRARSDLGCHPIHAAIEARQLEAARLILDAFPAAINLKAPHGRNPLHLAALRRDPEMYKFLVESGADPRALDQKGKTAEYYLKSSRKRRSRSQASAHHASRERSSSVRDTNPASVDTSARTTEVDVVTAPADKGALDAGAAGSAAQGSEKESADARSDIAKGAVGGEKATGESGGNDSGESGSTDGGGKSSHTTTSTPDSDVTAGRDVGGEVATAIVDTPGSTDLEAGNGDHRTDGGDRSNEQGRPEPGVLTASSDKQPAGVVSTDYSHRTTEEGTQVIADEDGTGVAQTEKSDGADIRREDRKGKIAETSFPPTGQNVADTAGDIRNENTVEDKGGIIKRSGETNADGITKVRDDDSCVSAAEGGHSEQKNKTSNDGDVNTDGQAPEEDENKDDVANSSPTARTSHEQDQKEDPQTEKGKNQLPSVIERTKAPESSEVGDKLAPNESDKKNEVTPLTTTNNFDTKTKADQFIDDAVRSNDRNLVNEEKKSSAQEQQLGGTNDSKEKPEVKKEQVSADSKRRSSKKRRSSEATDTQENSEVICIGVEEQLKTDSSTIPPSEGREASLPESKDDVTTNAGPEKEGTPQGVAIPATLAEKIDGSQSHAEKTPQGEEGFGSSSATELHAASISDSNGDRQISKQRTNEMESNPSLLGHASAKTSLDNGASSAGASQKVSKEGPASVNAAEADPDATAKATPKEMNKNGEENSTAKHISKTTLPKQVRKSGLQESRRSSSVASMKDQLARKPSQLSLRGDETTALQILDEVISGSQKPKSKTHEPASRGMGRQRVQTRSITSRPSRTNLASEKMNDRSRTKTAKVAAPALDKAASNVLMDNPVTAIGSNGGVEDSTEAPHQPLDGKDEIHAEAKEGNKEQESAIPAQAQHDTRDSAYQVEQDDSVRVEDKTKEEVSRVKRLQTEDTASGDVEGGGVSKGGEKSLEAQNGSAVPEEKPCVPRQHSDIVEEKEPTSTTSGEPRSAQRGHLEQSVEPEASLIKVQPKVDDAGAGKANATLCVPSDVAAKGASSSTPEVLAMNLLQSGKARTVEPRQQSSEKRPKNKGSKLSSSTSAQLDRLNELIDVWIKEGDLLRLEHVVIAGQGDRLLNRTSEDKQVQEFLGLVPAYMERIRTVHEAVVSGNMAQVRQVLTRKRFALSRDHLGASPLHLAVLHGHTDVLNYIVERFPETLDGPDNEGRTPLHYAAVVLEAQNYFDILKKAGADDTIKDKMGHTPEYYMKNPKDLSIRDLLANYQTTADDEKSAKADVWQRPSTPTAPPEESAAAEQPEADTVPATQPAAPTANASQMPAVPSNGDVRSEAKPEEKAQGTVPSAAPDAVTKATKDEVSKAPGTVAPETVAPAGAAPAVSQVPAPHGAKPADLTTQAKVVEGGGKGGGGAPRLPIEEPVQTAVRLPLAEEAAKQGLPSTITAGHLPTALPNHKHGQNGGGDMGGADTLQLAQSLLLADRTPEEAQYLRASVGDALAGALLAVAQQRPQDPVAFIASWLKQRQGRARIDQLPSRAPSLPATLPEQHSKNRDENSASRANTVSSSATR